MPESPTSPAARDPLENFPPEVRAAHERWLANKSPTDADIVILAVIRDFVPSGETTSRPAGAPLTDDAHLINDLGYDSLAIAEVVFFLEDIYAVRVNLEELQDVATIGDLRRHLRARVGDASA